MSKKNIRIRTVEQLRRETGSKKVRLQPAVVGTGADQKPLCFMDKDGNSTGIQKIAVINEAGQTLGWASMELCRDIQNKTFDKSRSLAILDEITDGITVNTTLIYAGGKTPLNRKSIQSLSQISQPELWEFLRLGGALDI